MKQVYKLYIETAVVLLVFCILLYVMIPHFLKAQNLNTKDNFPDSKFRRAVEKRMKVEPGGKVTAAQLACIRLFDCTAEGIHDMTGLAYFTGLTSLECSGNPLSELDLSGNPVLERLDCDRTGIKILNLSNNRNLIHLECSNNLVTEFDLSNNHRLRMLVCRYNQLTNLDLSGNPNLEYLYCDNNEITRLDLSNNKKIVSVSLTENKMTVLPVFPDTPGLKSLDLRGNPLDPQALKALETLTEKLKLPRFKASDWLDNSLDPVLKPERSFESIPPKK